MVSTYHVAELVRAVGGDRVTVEIISPSNVPVHDYEPSAADLIKLQDVDLFFYHGLNLEPWVESTISSLGSNAPLAVQTHAMPSGENTLDYQSMLLNNICEALNDDAFEAVTLADHHDEAGDVEIHAEAMTHKVSYPEMDDDHDDHGDDHDDHGDDHHQEMTDLMAIFNNSDANGDGFLNLTELESFIPAVTEYDEDDHDDHDDHDGHDDNETHDNHDGDETHDDDDHDDHDGNETHDDDIEGDDVPTPQDVLNFFDANNDSLLSFYEFWHAWE